MSKVAGLLGSIRNWVEVGTGHIGRLDLRSPWIWGSIFFFQISSLFAYDLGRREITHSLAQLIIAISFVSYWALYPALIKISDRAVPRSRWAWITVGLLVLGLGRGLLLEQLFIESSEQALGSFLSRIPGDVTVALITLIAMSELMHSSRRHVAAMARLTAANASLIENQRLTRTKASDTEANLRELAQSSLLGELDRIKSLLTAASQWEQIRDVADEIKTLITNEVRPLSRKLRDRLDHLNSTKELQALRRPLRFGRPNSVSAAQDTRIVATYLLSMPNILVTINALSDWQAALIALVVSFTIFPIGVALRALISKLTLERRLSNWIAMNAILVLSYLPLQFTVVKLIESHPGLLPLRFSGIGVFMFVGAAITLWRAIERSRAQIETELADLNQDLARSTAIVGQQIWIAQKKWAYLVHGTVQGALTVAASRLQLADEKNPVEVATILNDLDRAVAALKGETSLDQSFAQQASETRETWAGVLDIEISVAASAKNLLENAITARCAGEILKELAGNAYRHGKAKSLVISFTQDGNGDLRLTASNDGTNLGGDTPGLGSDLFSDLTMSWSVSNDANGVNFEAVLPAITP